MQAMWEGTTASHDGKHMKGSDSGAADDVDVESAAVSEATGLLGAGAGHEQRRG